MPKEVLIDGVRYAPVMEASPDAEAITRGILTPFWGEIPSSYTVQRAAEGLSVSINEDGKGTPVIALVAEILNRIQPKG